jgi:hypothetical protein
MPVRRFSSERAFQKRWATSLLAGVSTIHTGTPRSSLASFSPKLSVNNDVNLYGTVAISFSVYLAPSPWQAVKLRSLAR